QGPGHVFPTAYINALGHSDCLLSHVGTAEAAGAAPSGAAAPMFKDPDIPHLDPPRHDVAFPHLQSCDGVDNDGNAKGDEGCPDTDHDGLVDALDNCPRTVNPTQADLDHNFLGDACQYPGLTSLSEQRSGNDTTLKWGATTADVLGFDVYRV